MVVVGGRKIGGRGLMMVSWGWEAVDGGEYLLSIEMVPLVVAMRTKSRSREKYDLDEVIVQSMRRNA